MLANHSMLHSKKKRKKINVCGGHQLRYIVKIETYCKYFQCYVLARKSSPLQFVFRGTEDYRLWLCSKIQSKSKATYQVCFSGILFSGSSQRGMYHSSDWSVECRSHCLHSV